MTLNRDFNEIVAVRAQRDSAYAIGLLQEALAALLNDEPAVARLLLRDLINGTIGFEPLAIDVGIPSKSLHRMFSARGNPSMNNLSTIIGSLRRKLGVNLNVESTLNEDTEDGALELIDEQSPRAPYESALEPRSYKAFEKAYHQWFVALSGASERTLSRDTSDGIKAFTLIATFENRLKAIANCSPRIVRSLRLIPGTPTKNHSVALKATQNKLQFPENELDQLAEATASGIRTLSKSLKLDLIFDDFPFVSAQIKRELNKELDEKITELTHMLNGLKVVSTRVSLTAKPPATDLRVQRDCSVSRDHLVQCSEQVASLIRVLRLEKDKHMDVT